MISLLELIMTALMICHPRVCRAFTLLMMRKSGRSQTLRSIRCRRHLRCGMCRFYKAAPAASEDAGATNLLPRYAREGVIGQWVGARFTPLVAPPAGVALAATSSSGPADASSRGRAACG